MLGGMVELLLAAAIVFGVNLLPAFGPPTWSVLVGLALWLDPPKAALVTTGALAAASGRFLLALGARRLRHLLSPERVEGLEHLRRRVLDRPAGAVTGLGLFALSPVPSAQLFIAAGLTGVRLPLLTIAFFSGRLVSYGTYVAGAAAFETAARDALGAGLTSPAGIALQVLLLAGLIALVRVDWVRRLDRRTPRTRRAGGRRRSRAGSRGRGAGAG